MRKTTYTFYTGFVLELLYLVRLYVVKHKHKNMKALIKKIPYNWEATLLIPLTLGYFIISSFWWVGSIHENYEYTFTNPDALFFIAYELGTLSLFIWILKVRGWKKEEFGIEISWELTGGGFLLFLVNFLLFYIAYALFQSLSNDSNIFDNIKFSYEVIFPLSTIMIVINSFFEEVIVAAYLVTALSKRHDVLFVIGVSLLVRILYHTYQGPIITASILPMGILFSYVYWKWRKLWPLVFAHTVWNIMAFT